MSITPKRVSVSHTKFLPPPPKAPLVSWWIDPILQTDRAAFDKQLADSEYQRITGSQRYGGSKRVFDDFPQTAKR